MHAEVWCWEPVLAVAVSCAWIYFLVDWWLRRCASFRDGSALDHSPFFSSLFFFTKGKTFLCVHMPVFSLSSSFISPLLAMFHFFPLTFCFRSPVTCLKLLHANIPILPPWLPPSLPSLFPHFSLFHLTLCASTWPSSLASSWFLGFAGTSPQLQSR